MIDQQTTDKLLALRLRTMAEVFREFVDKRAADLTFEEKVGMMVDREWCERDNRRNGRRIKEAKFPSSASIEEVATDPARGLDKAAFRSLAACGWVRAKQNVIVLGSTGVGKSFLACALANAACRQGFRAYYARVPRLVHQLTVARADGSYSTELGRLSRFDVLVLDDFLIAPMKDTERRDLRATPERVREAFGPYCERAPSLHVQARQRRVPHREGLGGGSALRIAVDQQAPPRSSTLQGLQAVFSAKEEMKLRCSGKAVRSASPK